MLVSKQYGVYTIPGGGIELGEMLEEGLKREVKEETGIDIANPKLVACRSGYFKLPHSTKGVHIQSISLFYRCDAIGGEPTTAYMTDEELAGGGQPPEWIKIEDLDKLPINGSIDWRSLAREVI